MTIQIAKGFVSYRSDDSGNRFETLYVQCEDGKQFQRPEREANNNFPRRGWLPADNVAIGGCEYIGDYEVEV